MTATLIKASAHDTGLDSGSVHTICTSPPYFGLRSYSGDQAVDWPSVEYAPMPGLPTITIQAMSCGLGEEPTPEAFIGHMVLVMREMWRVLRDDGTCWVNLGDSFAANRGYQVTDNKHVDVGNNGGMKVPAGLRAKSKMMIPHRFALAMQAEGWIVRNDIVWAKGVSFLPDYAGSCMPYSGQDNVTPSHEYIFPMAKRGRYYYDNVAVKEGLQPSSVKRLAQDIESQVGTTRANGGAKTNGNLKAVGDPESGRNLRSVWVINPGSYAGAHFAVFPDRIPDTCIKAGTSAKGVCPECGAQWRRIVERTAMEVRTSEKGAQKHADGLRTSTSGTMTKAPTSTTTGWEPTCTCDAGEPVPATVLDPFNGSGTTAKAALHLGRNAIGIDLSDEYFEQTEKRLANTQPLLSGLFA